MNCFTRYLVVSAIVGGLAARVYAEVPRYQPQTNGAFPPAWQTQAEGLATRDFPLVPTSMAGYPKQELNNEASSNKDVCCPTTLGRWWVQGDVLFWDRIGNGCDQVLAVSTDPPEAAVLNTNELDFSMEPGLRVLVGYRPDPCGPLGCCSALEFSYFGIYGWDDSIAAAGDQNLAIPGTLGLVANNFLFADEIRADYRSRLNNVEANCIKSCCIDCCTQVDFLLGFRFLALDEDFSLTGTDVLEGTSSYDISTSNYLYGLQMGGRMTRRMQLWSLQFTGKGALFLNDAEQSQIVTDFPNAPDAFVHRHVSGVSGTSAAMLGEVDLTLVRRITNVWSARLGYNVMGLGGLALAPNQLDFTVTPTSGTALAKDGFVLFHGAHAGLEAVW
jgi:hypothetical protein